MRCDIPPLEIAPISCNLCQSIGGIICNRIWCHITGEVNGVEVCPLNLSGKAGSTTTQNVGTVLYRGLWVSLAKAAHRISMKMAAKTSPSFCSHPSTSSFSLRA